MITTKILADSINPAGRRITTWELTYPRFIHSEIMTHRMFARNAASSRAIPIEKMIAALETNPATFEQYGAANKTMQAKDLMPEQQIADFLEEWTALAGKACSFADKWKTLVAKQIVNRALEPWMHMTIICTATEWDNFYALRAHPDAQPEFQVLAYRMLDKWLRAKPASVNYGAWHLPLITKEEWASGVCLNDLKKISAARCARVSYTTHDTIKNIEDDIKLHDRLASSGHMSPFEHQAVAIEYGSSGPFRGWQQYRKEFSNENRERQDLWGILANKPKWIEL